MKITDFQFTDRKIPKWFLGIVQVIFYRLWPEKNYLGNSAGADCNSLKLILSYERNPPPRTRVKWVPFVLLSFFPCFTVFFVSKLANWPFWEPEKAIFGPEKDKWWIWGSKTPKPPEMPIKLGKTSQHHNWPRYMDWPQIGPKIAIEQGKKRQKNKWYLFRAPTPPPPGPRFWSQDSWAKNGSTRSQVMSQRHMR